MTVSREVEINMARIIAARGMDPILFWLKRNAGRTCAHCSIPITNRSRTGRCSLCRAEHERGGDKRALKRKAERERKAAEVQRQARSQTEFDKAIEDMRLVQLNENRNHRSQLAKAAAEASQAEIYARHHAEQQARLAALTKARAKASKPPLSFEEQLARVAQGAGLAEVVPFRRPDPSGTLGGVASALL